jgi:hypothetical protein
MARLEEDLDMTAPPALLVSTAQEQATHSLMAAAHLDTTALHGLRLHTSRPRSLATIQRRAQLLRHLAQQAPMARSRLSLLACRALLGFTVPIRACLTPIMTAQRARIAQL